MTKLLAVLALLVPAVASAETDLGAESRATVGLGLFTPTGSLSVEYAYVPHPNVELAVGAGLGFSGPQVAVMPRLRSGGGPVSFSIGGGVSAGMLTVPVLLCFDEDGCADTKTSAVWANAEAGFLFTNKTGFVMRIYAGVGRVIALGDCTGDGCMTAQNLELPYFGVSIGRTL